MSLLFSSLARGQVAAGFLYPFFFCLALALALRLAGGAAARAAGIALPLAVYAAQAVASDVWFPPAGPPDYRALYLAVAGGALGALLDASAVSAPLRRMVLALWPALALALVGGRRLAIELPGDPLILILLWLAGAATLLRLDQARRRDAEAPLMLGAASAGAAAVALATSITSLISPFAGFGAASLALAVLSFRRPPRPFGMAALLGGGGAWFALMATFVLHAGAPRLSILLLLLPFLADLAWRRGAGGALRWLRAAVIGALAFIPALAAMLIALP